MTAGENVARAHDRFRIDLFGGGEGEQQRLVGRHVIEHTGEKSRRARGLA